MHPITHALLALYARVQRTGLLETRVGYRLFVWAYLTYKRLFEARHARAVLTYIVPNSTVIDVGANIGFFSVLFAQHAHVIAIEPEPRNYAELVRQTAGRPVTTYQAVVSDHPGHVILQLDPLHPANHRISPHGHAPENSLSVAALTLDALVKQHQARVSFIKIDVQGAEMQVLRGGHETLRQQRPVVQIEVDDNALRDFGTTAADLLAHMAALDYAPHLISQPPRLLSPVEALAVVQAAGYTDLLFLPQLPDGTTT